MRDFDADRKLCDAAKPGPWEYVLADCKEPHTVMGASNHDGSATSVCHTPWMTPGTESTFRFIAAAREGWPAALDEIERLRTRVKEIATHSEDARDMHDALTALLGGK